MLVILTVSPGEEHRMTIWAFEIWFIILAMSTLMGIVFRELFQYVLHSMYAYGLFELWFLSNWHGGPVRLWYF